MEQPFLLPGFHRCNVPNSPLSAEQAEAFASNPNALIEPAARAELPGDTLAVLQESMTSAVHPVFWVGAIVCVLALFVSFMLPSHRKENLHDTSEDCGETMLMAEQTTINARNQPDANSA